jgi:hypothetical protein
VQYLAQFTYISLSQLLFYVVQTWPLILASSAIVLLLFAVAGIAILKRLFQIREVT